MRQMDLHEKKMVANWTTSTVTSSEEMALNFHCQMKKLFVSEQEKKLSICMCSTDRYHFFSSIYIPDYI